MADRTHIDIARLGDAGEVAAELTRLLIAVVRDAGGEVEVRPEDLEERGEILLCDPTPEGRLVVRVAPRAQQDERVPAGGWIHVLTGAAVHVEGVSHEGLVIVRHQLGELGEHRADQDVETFLKAHVRADAVPFIGGES